MTNADLELQGIAESFLDLLPPETSAIAVTSTTIGQKQNFISMWISNMANLQPPGPQIVHGKFRRVFTDTYRDESFIANGVVEAVRDANAFGHRRKVMVEDLSGFASPGLTVLIELPDEFAIFRINTDHGELLVLVLTTLLVDIEKLLIATLVIGRFARCGLDTFSVFS